ncbi:hypothetical protein [Streptomyces anulatus]|uniref:hypothetical protein n=1 Tax=Streptomyces anulatus TaxID=1892 RepID=UPI001C271569|nr:hypothetical protein [Streptomyces anulatus]
MYETFELLRSAAENSRAAARRRHGGIDPVSWEALLDRVEDQLDEDEQDDHRTPTGKNSASVARAHAHVALTPSLVAGGVLGAALIPVAFGGDLASEFLFVGAALAGLALPAALSRGRGDAFHAGRRSITAL